MKVIAIIPARAGSKRFPNKNTAVFNGKPLIQYSIDYAKSNSCIDAIFVSTNDPKIKMIAKAQGVEVIDRPEHLCGDLEPTVSSLKHVIETIDFDVEHIILLQPTNPLRPKGLLDEAFKTYTEKKCDSLFTVTRNYDKLGTINNNKFKPFNYKVGQRSQDLEPLYFENGLLYITKSSCIKEDTIITENAYPLEVNHVYSSIDIDTVEDFNYAKFILEHYPNE